MLRSFLPVGQGAFYCEQFHLNGTQDNINIVYDCGSSTDKNIVEQEIRNNFRQGEVVEALFISHLHDDHINGVPYLLQYCNVKKIYFPLITATNKKLMAIYYQANNIGNLSSAFLEDPYGTVRNWSRDNLPTLIGIDEIGNEDLDRDLRQDREQYQRSGENVFSHIIHSYKLNGTVYDKWLYVPFNFRQSGRLQILLSNLKNEFGRTITETDMVKMWEDNLPGNRDKIKQAYAKVPGGFNVNSMTLFSGEVDRALRQQKRGCCGKHCFLSRKSSGCLYMGDYDAAGPLKWKDLTNAYQKYWNHIGCVQVPHHGSGYNFNANLLHLNAFFVISAGYANRYHHPHSSVVKAFLLHGVMPHIVTEHVGSAAYFVVL